MRLKVPMEASPSTAVQLQVHFSSSHKFASLIQLLPGEEFRWRM
jgi:hypothetical protein